MNRLRNSGQITRTACRLSIPFGFAILVWSFAKLIAKNWLFTVALTLKRATPCRYILRKDILSLI